MHFALSGSESPELRLDEPLERQARRLLEEPRARLLKGSAGESGAAQTRTVKLSDLLDSDSDEDLRQDVEASKMSSFLSGREAFRHIPKDRISLLEPRQPRRGAPGQSAGAAGLRARHQVPGAHAESCS